MHLLWCGAGRIIIVSKTCNNAIWNLPPKSRNAMCLLRNQSSLTVHQVIALFIHCLCMSMCKINTWDRKWAGGGDRTPGVVPLATPYMSISGEDRELTVHYSGFFKVRPPGKAIIRNCLSVSQLQTAYSRLHIRKTCLTWWMQGIGASVSKLHELSPLRIIKNAISNVAECQWGRTIGAGCSVAKWERDFYSVYILSTTLVDQEKAWCPSEGTKLSALGDLA